MVFCGIPSCTLPSEYMCQISGQILGLSPTSLNPVSSNTAESHPNLTYAQ